MTTAQLEERLDEQESVRQKSQQDDFYIPKIRVYQPNRFSELPSSCSESLYASFEAFSDEGGYN